MYTYKVGMLPTSFDHLFANLENIHNYTTRNKTNYRFDIHKIKSILIDEPKFWNLLPREVKSSSSVSTFKKSLTSFLRNIHKLNTFYYYIVFLASGALNFSKRA